MSHEPPIENPHKSLWWHLRRGLREARARRPASFYFLLSIPLVLLLAAHMLEYRSEPKRFALILGLLFVFFGVVLLRAIMDLFEITRKHLREYHESYRRTLGEREFMEQLGARMEEGRREEQ